jgi:phenylacetate-CoA ligase
LRVVAEYGNGTQDQAMLQKKVEDKIKAVLSVSSAVQLVPAGTLPRFEMKGQLIRKLYEE